MTPKKNHILSQAEHQATFHDLLQERMRLAIHHTLVTVLEEEVDNFIQAALYQHTPERKDYRNGQYERDLVTTLGEIDDLPVPRTRGSFVRSSSNATSVARPNWMKASVTCL